MTFRAAWAWHSRSPILFIATAEPNLCPVDTPQSLDLWEPWTSHTHTHNILEGLGEGGLGVVLVGGAPSTGTLQLRRTSCFCSLGNNY